MEMFCLPEQYSQRENKIFKCTKPQIDIFQRNYLVGLLRGLLSNGYFPVLSGLDTVLPILPLFANEIAFIDYGFNIELAKRFSSSIAKVNFDEDGYPASILGGIKRKKAIILFDLLCEVTKPECMLEGVKNALSGDDLFFFVCPERESQKNKHAFGPPSAEFRMREWSLIEIRQFILSFFELETISSRLVRQNLNNQRKDILISNAPSQFLGDICDTTIHFDQIASVDTLSPSPENCGFSFELTKSNYTPPGSTGLHSYIKAREVKEVILDKLRSRSPYSLIRVGHAEIRTLGFPDFVHPVWASRSLSVCFGRGDVSDMYFKLVSEMLTAFKNADILGVPTTLENDQHWRNAIPLLGYYGCRLDNKLLVSQNIHLHLLEQGSYNEIIEAANNVLLIGCRDLRSRIENRFKVEVDYISIPGEAKFVENAKSHYPDFYEDVKAQIAQKKASLVLVGAGLPGNVYCDAARENGLVSLDIGSVMDIWAGLNTRTSFKKYSKYSFV